MGKRILFTTSVRRGRHYDYLETNSRRRLFRYSWPRTCSYGLRFLKQNLPEIEILEFPTWREYAKEIRKGDYDIVGFSFYINDVPDVLKMVEFARKSGVKEIWGGNYGVLTPGVEEHFDRIFTGYCEAEVAKELGKRIKRIKHPPLVQYIGSSLGPKICIMGLIFTSRGCNLSCKLCQTPSFSPEVSTIDIRSLKEVLGFYRRNDVMHIGIEEENFGLSRQHSRKAIDEIQSIGFNWGGMFRADILQRNLDDWIGKGMVAAYVGVENLNQRNLDDVDKREDARDILNLLRELKKNRIYTGIFYMIGFENETRKSIMRDMKTIRRLGVDVTQVCVVTPLPRTPLWNHIEENYGISDYDWAHYDTKHLVWNHPNIKPAEMSRILNDCYKIAQPRIRSVQTTLKWARNLKRGKGIVDWLSFMGRMVYKSNTFDYRKFHTT